jgi:hypothetical protein
MSTSEETEAAQRVLGFVRAHRLAGGPEVIDGISFQIEDGEPTVFSLLATDLEALAGNVIGAVPSGHGADPQAVAVTEQPEVCVCGHTYRQHGSTPSTSCNGRGYHGRCPCRANQLEWRNGS